MTPDQMIVRLKEMGLIQVQRSSVMDTYRAEGEREALRHAKRMLKSNADFVSDAKGAAAQLFGIKI